MNFRRKVGDNCVAKSKADEWLDQDKLTLLEGWARDGLTDEQIANNIGISRSTLFEWRKNNQDISNALKKGKEIVDIEVENALLKKALGYNVPIQKAFKIKEVIYQDGKRLKETERIEYAEEQVHVPADTTAQIFWLKNRKPDKWRDKVVDTENEEAITNATDILVKIRKTVDDRYERS